jgi:predicted dehydrogenase
MAMPRRGDVKMINAAVVGLGRWGKSIVEAVQGRSGRIRVVHGVSKEPETVREFPEAGAMIQASRRGPA